MTPAEEFAPAKVNLCLHVTGRRGDGYHLLDSVAVFAGVGDRVLATPGEGLRLRVTGPRGCAVPAGSDNLVIRAAALFGRVGAILTLDKHLPAASGIGGGSADAAATLRALARLWSAPLPAAAAVLALGADVPVCLAGRPVRMQGVGECLTPLPPLPTVWLVLVNCGQPVSTPSVFAALSRRDNPPLPGLPDDGWPDAPALAGWLRGCRNDLQAAAIAIAPTIATTLSALERQPGCLLARMSGSGATCFGLFGAMAAARSAAEAIGAERPDWWVAAAPVLADPGPA